MTIHRRAAKRDANEREIITALEAAGCTVQQLSGKGVPDLLVGAPDFWEKVGTSERNVLMEVKQPGEKLTKDQEVWHRDWRGQIAIVFSVEDALRIIGRL